MRFIAKDKLGHFAFVATAAEAKDADAIEQSVVAACIVRGLRREEIEVRLEALGSVFRVTLKPRSARHTG